MCKYCGNSNKNIKNEYDGNTQHLYYFVPQNWSCIRILHQPRIYVQFYVLLTVHLEICV
jgi:hypothetical protein